jgi:MFS family permease
MSVKTFTRLFCAFQFFRDFILVYAVDKLFFLERGLELRQIAILLVIWSVMAIILEVPSGALADRWSRKNMLILSGVADSLGFAIWLFSPSFWLFLLGFVFLTIGGTFTSGTLQAYVYDFLKLNEKEGEFERIWGRGHALRLIGIAVAMSLGGILSTRSYELVLVFSSLSPLMVSVVALLLPQIKPLTSTKERGYFTLLKGGVRRAFSNPALLRVFIYSGIVLATFGVLEEYDQVLLSFRLGLPNSFIGIWLAAGIGVSSICAFYAHRIKHVSWLVLNIVAVVTGVILIIVALSKSLLLLGILLLLGVFNGLVGVLTQGMIQKEIDSDERATITSVNTFVVEIGAIILGLTFAFVADRFGIHIGYDFFGAVVLVYSLGHVLIKR